MTIRKSIQLFILIMLMLSGCIHPAQPPYIKSEDYGCKPPPPDVFEKTGINMEFAQLTFGKIIVGGIKVENDPQIITIASKAVINDRIRSYLRCLTIKRDGYSKEQAAYFDLLAAFLQTKPNATQFSEWQKENKFPKEKNAEIWYEKGLRFYLNGEYQKAIEMFSKFIEENPESAKGYGGIGASYIKIAERKSVSDNNVAVFEYQTAIRYLKKALELNSEDKEAKHNIRSAYTNMGANFLQRGELQEATHCFHKAIELEPNDAVTYYNIGAAYEHFAEAKSKVLENVPIKEFQEALIYFQKAININNNYGNAIKAILNTAMNLGGAYDTRGDLSTAIKYYSLAIETETKINEVLTVPLNNHLIYRNRGLAYAKLKKYQMAIADFNKATEMNPNYADTFFWLGLVYHESGLSENKAIDSWQKAARLGDERAISTLKDNGIRW